ncbi:hypothetical protein MPLDJ20_100093 [Mesorhizobium plurifarium]|uniref:Uncharacterized protein n=1 Tax=Mesorhizobium plurifarium TaxID=69974 RepID=A0A090F5Q8_MESPL|nr:hypothetical protein MPLDJ20_100093 [Mesorhizobium plurifarium]
MRAIAGRRPRATSCHANLLQNSRFAEFCRSFSYSHSIINLNIISLIFLINFNQLAQEYRQQYRQIATLLKSLQQCSRRRGMHAFDSIVS